MSRITFGSVCSGIEAASSAWEALGWKADWLAEIEPFPAAVLAYRYPDVPNLGDMKILPRLVLSGVVAAPDVLVGGTPCQSFSVAGLRGSLEDERGQLTMAYIKLLNKIDEVRSNAGRKPAIAVWENVPGVLSSKDNAFGCFIAGLAGESSELQPPRERWSNAGYVLGPQRAVAWRVLDAQYFGLAQRRKRVFVVASARNGFDPAKILFEFDGVRRDIAPSRESGQEAACDAATSSGKANPVIGALCARDYKGVGSQYVTEGKLVIEPDGVPYQRISHCLNAGGMGRQDYETESFVVHGETCFGTLGNSISRKPENGGNAVEPHHDRAPYSTTTDRHGAAGDFGVRRLTPTECERLQGFPDGWTQIPWRNKPAEECPDGHRYKALGNSMAVPVMRWIGERISKKLSEALQ